MKNISKLLSVLFLALFLTGCFTKTTSEITIGYIAMNTTSPQALVATEYGLYDDFFKSKKIEVKWDLTRGLEDVWAKMENEEFDFVYLPATNSLSYYTDSNDKYGGGDNYRIIAGVSKANSYTLLGGEAVQSLEDLDGKTVGIVNFFYLNEVMLNDELQKVGMATVTNGGTVNVQYIHDVGGLRAAFEKGEIDAFVLGNGQINNVLGNSEGWHRIRPIGGVLPNNYLLTRQSLIENEPELVKSFLEAHIQASEVAVEKKAELPHLSRARAVSYFEGKGLSAENLDPIENYERAWGGLEITVDPHKEFLTRVHEFTYKNGYTNAAFDILANLSFIEELK